MTPSPSLCRQPHEKKNNPYTPSQRTEIRSSFGDAAAMDASLDVRPMLAILEVHAEVVERFSGA